jgi:circadian clock protein KaiB
VIKTDRFKFRLYIAGDTQNSAQALSNLRSLCNSNLAGRHEIEIVDVFRNPKRALADGILMTPTLIRLAPLPLLRIVGTLSQPEPLLLILRIESGDP